MRLKEAIKALKFHLSDEKLPCFREGNMNFGCVGAIIASRCIILIHVESGDNLGLDVVQMCVDVHGCA